MIFAALVDKQLTWHLARAGGIVAWLVTAASVIWGLTLSTRLVRRPGISGWLLDVHRFLGTLGIVFTGVHLSGMFFDRYEPFGLSELFVPMASNWRPGAVSWGIVALYLLVAIQVTSRFMRHLPRRLWHSIHLTSFAVFAFGTVHGYQAGADADNIVVQGVCIAVCTAVVVLTLARVRALRRTRARRSPLSTYVDSDRVMPRGAVGID